MIGSGLRLGLLTFTIVVLAQTQPKPTPSDECLQGPLAGGATTQGEKHPLQTLPYTPGLDLDSMDRTADPCVDFYQFVCGGWMKNNPVAADQPSWSVYSKLADESDQFLWGILEEAADPGRARSPLSPRAAARDLSKRECVANSRNNQPSVS